MELKLGDKVNIWGYTAKFVEWDDEYFYFKHEWSPAVFKIKKEEIKCFDIIKTTTTDN